MKKIIRRFAALVAIAFGCIAYPATAQWSTSGNAATTSNFLGTTNNVSLRVRTNNVQRMIVDSLGRVGIGIALPKQILSVQGGGSVPAASWISAGAPLFAGYGETITGNADFVMSMASAAANARPVFVGRRGRGTLAAPATVANNDFLLSFLTSGFDGSAFQNPATIDFFVDGTPTAGNVPARISFVTGSNSGNRAERLKIGSTGDISMNNNQLFVQKATGNVGIGNILPTAKLEVTGQVKITGGTPGAGKILTSDSNGLASWAVPASVPETDPKVAVIVTDTSAVPRWNGSALVGGTIKDNGTNVGIGTATPTAKLDITGNVKIADGTQGNGKVLTSDANGLSSWQTVPVVPETDPQVNAATTNQIPKWNGTTLTDGTITDNGNVGIGEANPQGALHVSQPGIFSGVAFAGTGLNDLTANISGYTGTGTTTYVIKINNAGPDPNLIQVSNNGGSSFGAAIPIANPIFLSNGVTATFAATGGHTFGDQWTWSVTKGFNDVLVADSGRIGINTKNPVATLDVVGGDARINGLTVGRGKGFISSNTAVGFQALDSNTFGGDNTAVGRFALLNNTTGSFNTANGASALLINTTGSSNTAYGTDVLRNNTTGRDNTASGDFALVSNATGSSNTANGVGALSGNTIGFSNVAIGIRALRNNSTGSNLVAIGDSALFNQNGGNGSNTAVGSKALFANTTGSSNVAMGNSALRKNTTGTDMVAIGDSALFNCVTNDGRNTAVGSKALFSNTFGTLNTANGINTLFRNTSGSSNTANGAFALFNNTTGSSNTVNGVDAMVGNTTGSNNTATGIEALEFNETGSSNVAIGIGALRFNSAGSNMVAIGDSALFNQDGGNGRNTAVGSKALLTNTTGANNTANGFNALRSNTTGSSNVAVGSSSLRSNTTGSNLVGIGDSALFANTTGANNIAHGSEALRSNTTGSANIAIGVAALFSNTTRSNQVAIGDSALFSHNGGNGFNTAIGSKVLFADTSGNENTGVGFKTLSNTTSGSFNSAFGTSALTTNTTGSNNVAVGTNTMVNNTTGTGNTVSGVSAMRLNIDGSSNAAIGISALRGNTTGSNNASIGDSALRRNATGNDNTAAGSKAYSNNTTNFSNATALGANTAITASDMLRLGASTVTSIGGQVGYTTISDGRFKTNVEANVPGMEFIKKLRPITYHLDVTGIDQFTNIHYTTAEQLKARQAKEQLTYTGFIAQEVEAAAKSVNFNFSGVDKPQNDRDMYGLRYAEFVVPLVKAVQELSQQNEQLKKSNADLETRFAKMESMMQQLINSKPTAPCPPLAGQ